MAISTARRMLVVSITSRKVKSGASGVVPARAVEVSFDKLLKILAMSLRMKMFPPANVPISIFRRGLVGLFFRIEAISRGNKNTDVMRIPAQLSTESPRRVPAMRYFSDMIARAARGRRTIRSKMYMTVPSFSVRRTS